MNLESMCTPNWSTLSCHVRFTEARPDNGGTSSLRNVGIRPHTDTADRSMTFYNTHASSKLKSLLKSYTISVTLPQ